VGAVHHGLSCTATAKKRCADVMGGALSKRIKSHSFLSRWLALSSPRRGGWKRKPRKSRGRLAPGPGRLSAFPVARAGDTRGPALVPISFTAGGPGAFGFVRWWEKRVGARQAGTGGLGTTRHSREHRILTRGGTWS
jgi:hypothetical protein